MQTKSFTLIEIIITITMVGILSFFVIVQTNSAVNAGRDSKRKLDVSLLSNAIVSYSNDNYYTKPITDADGCTINGDCPSSVSEALSPYLSSLPSDPDGASKYVYQSDGSDCTISATLSNGIVYQYACESNANTEGTPTPGVCGSAAVAYNPGTTDFTGTYCDSGRLSSTPAFPAADGTYVTWNCLGEYLGPSTVCTAYRGQDGSCGTTANTTSTALAPTASFPTNNYCSTGTISSTPSDPAQGSSSTWTCTAKYKGTDATCLAYRAQNGACGDSASGNYRTSAGITNLCSTGSSTSITSSGVAANYFKWNCNGVYNGSSSQCTANLIVDGVCGAANGGIYLDVPASSSRCYNATTPTNTTSWSWGCNGLNGGNNTTSTACSATYGANGSCSTTKGVCNVGSASSVSITDIYYYGWSCSGVGAGSSVSCKVDIPLTNGTHVARECRGIGMYFCSSSDGTYGLDGGYCWCAGNGTNRCVVNCGLGYTCGQLSYTNWSCLMGDCSYAIQCR